MRAAPLLLALDTATSTASVALFDGERVVSETTWLAGREHSTRLLVEVDLALQRVGRTPSDLTGLVVARGPGSFTGVRVALSVAKGIAAARGLPLWGISSLDVTAHGMVAPDLPVQALLEAGRGRYATALYRAGQCIEPPRLVSLDGLIQHITERTLVVGELRADARERLARETPAVVASAAVGLRRGGVLAELGWRLAQAGERGDPREVDALYVS